MILGKLSIINHRLTVSPSISPGRPSDVARRSLHRRLLQPEERSQIVKAASLTQFIEPK